jgi:hypothetical protein
LKRSTLKGLTKNVYRLKIDKKSLKTIASISSPMNAPREIASSEGFQRAQLIEISQTFLSILE